MKKIWTLMITSVLSLMLVSTAFGAPADVAASVFSIPKDEPVSTTGTLYGYDGTFDIYSAYTHPANLTEEEWELTDAQMLYWEGPAIQTGGTATLVVRNSYIRGETAAPTTPADGGSSALLIAGNINTVMSTEFSQDYVINSSVIARNQAAVTLAAAGQSKNVELNQLSYYTYGSEVIAMDGGCGVYTGPLSILYSYGSHIQAAETGILSDTFGYAAIGTIGDGENDPEFGVRLSEADREKRSDKQMGSVIEGGRNALDITSANNPAYWVYSGYSEKEIPFINTYIYANGSVLRTDRSLDKGVEYSPQQQAYINHTAGSVILIRSTNAVLALYGCDLVPDPDGTGCLVQTVCSNDTVYPVVLEDGTYTSGIEILMQDMNVTGDIVHEDYQRLLNLTLKNTTLDGALNEYDCEHWNKAAMQEGFTDYIHNETYGTHHGLQLNLAEGSVWNVTEESHLSSLNVEYGSQINGTIVLDGMEQEFDWGRSYDGNITVKPLAPSETKEPEIRREPETESYESWEPEPETDPEEEQDEEPDTEPEDEQESETDPGEEQEPDTDPSEDQEPSEEAADHEHQWLFVEEFHADCKYDGFYSYKCAVEGCNATHTEPNGELAHGHDMELYSTNPATCTTDGENVYVCNYCSVSETEVIPALGHDWELTSSVKATCTEWGEDVYTCSRCGETHIDEFAPTGHSWHPDEIVYPTCTEDGHDTYRCVNCGLVEVDTWYATGHDWELTESVSPTCTEYGYDLYTCTKCGETYKEDINPSHTFIVYPTPGDEATTHTYECTVCGFYYPEGHIFGFDEYCDVCGY